jgi:hypothetical protein
VRGLALVTVLAVGCGATTSKAEFRRYEEVFLAEQPDRRLALATSYLADYPTGRYRHAVADVVSTALVSRGIDRGRQAAVASRRVEGPRHSEPARENPHARDLDRQEGAATDRATVSTEPDGGAGGGPTPPPRQPETRQARAELPDQGQPRESIADLQTSLAHAQERLDVAQRARAEAREAAADERRARMEEARARREAAASARRLASEDEQQAEQRELFCQAAARIWNGLARYRGVQLGGAGGTVAVVNRAAATLYWAAYAPTQYVADMTTLLQAVAGHLMCNRSDVTEIVVGFDDDFDGRIDSGLTTLARPAVLHGATNLPFVLAQQAHPARNASASPLARPGSACLVNFRGAGWYYAGVVTSDRQDGSVDVVYADGSTERVAAPDLIEDTIGPGSRVEARARTWRRFYRGVVTSRVGHAVHLRYDDGDSGWTSVALVRVARSRINEANTSGAVPPPAGPGTPGSEVLAAYRGLGLFFPGVITAVGVDGSIAVVYADGDTEVLRPAMVRNFGVEVGTAVEVSTLLGAAPAVVSRRVGHAVLVRFPDGSSGWTALARVRVR